MPEQRAPHTPPRGNARRLSRYAIWASLGLFLLFIAISSGPQEISRWQVALAREQAIDQPDRAMETVDDALAWDPHNRAAVELRMNVLVRRATVLQAKAHATGDFSLHQQAIADMNQVLEYADETGASPAERMRYVNHRAYTIARAAAASPHQVSEAELGAALVEMGEVLQELARENAAAADDGEYARMSRLLNEVGCLDTYAYLRLFARDEQAARTALRNFNLCLDNCDYLEELAKDLKLARTESAAAMQSFIEEINGTRPVVLHHRAEAYEKLSQRAREDRDYSLAKYCLASARRDKQAAIRLGYNPATGNW